MVKQEKEKLILGIDPGTNVMGYGLLSVKGNNLHFISMEVFTFNGKDHAIKLKKIFESTLQLIDEHHPDELAVEAPFFGKNIQSMLKLGRAQGVSMAAALYRNIPIFEYSPRKIKQAVTGKGNASKEQVAAMISTILKIKISDKKLDATDAMAAALCHHFQRDSEKISGTKFNGWKNFVESNPGKVVR
ncbi:MAG: crossover junction endodeoxyribonuclease RuvC [Bacteroidia bacterium]|nr:crossover junction endodeoxyribonuclease RuvC [Bacteroidia bacterium]